MPRPSAKRHHARLCVSFHLRPRPSRRFQLCIVYVSHWCETTPKPPTRGMVSCWSSRLAYPEDWPSWSVCLSSWRTWATHSTEFIFSNWRASTARWRSGFVRCWYDSTRTWRPVPWPTNWLGSLGRSQLVMEYLTQGQMSWLSDSAVVLVPRATFRFCDSWTMDDVNGLPAWRRTCFKNRLCKKPLAFSGSHGAGDASNRRRIDLSKPTTSPVNQHCKKRGWP